MSAKPDSDRGGDTSKVDLRLPLVRELDRLSLLLSHNGPDWLLSPDR